MIDRGGSRTLPALAVLLCWACPPAAGGGPSASPLPLPRGVADEDGRTGFLVNRTGGIDALALATGELLWSTDTPARPLVPFGSRLAVEVPDARRPNVIRVAVLNVARKGKRLLLSDPVFFPEWASVNLDYGRSFASSGSVRDGELFLRWEAHAFYDGDPPSRQQKQAARRDASGVVRVDLDTGRVRMLGPEPPPDGLVKVRRELSRGRAQSYWDGHDWTTDPLLVGDTLVKPWWEEAPDGRLKVGLRRWDPGTGKGLGSTELLRGTKLRPAVSLDGRHLLVEAVPAEAGAWLVFDLPTGKAVGRLSAPAGPFGVAVVGPHAYFTECKAMKMRPRGVMEQPTKLKAVSLKTGQTLWERPVAPRRALVPLP